MRTFRVAVGVALAALALPVVHATAAGPTYDSVGTTRLYALVNAHRLSMGLPALTVDTRLADVAKGWTLHMATTGTLAHNDALFTRAMHTRLGIKSFGENVAYANLGVDRANVILLESPHHRENIENAGFAVAGFAVYDDGKGLTWVTEDFGSAPGVVVAPAPRPPAARRPAPAPKPAPAAPRVVARPAPAPRPRTAALPARIVPVAHGGVSVERVDVSPPAVASAALPAAAPPRWPVLLAAVLVGTLAMAGRRTLRA